MARFAFTTPMPKEGRTGEHPKVICRHGWHGFCDKAKRDWRNQSEGSVLCNDSIFGSGFFFLRERRHIQLTGSNNFGFSMRPSSRALPWLDRGFPPLKAMLTLPVAFEASFWVAHWLFGGQWYRWLHRNDGWHQQVRMGPAAGLELDGWSCSQFVWAWGYSSVTFSNIKCSFGWGLLMSCVWPSPKTFLDLFFKVKKKEKHLKTFRKEKYLYGFLEKISGWTALAEATTLQQGGASAYAPQSVHLLPLGELVDWLVGLQMLLKSNKINKSLLLIIEAFSYLVE